ncbi:MAG: ATP-dependent helicase HrpB [Prochlorococcaceae cyanobacterium]
MNPGLPIDGHLAAITAALGPGATVLLQAPPGAGKTTRVPLALLAALPSGRILMLEPRRLAAKAAAERLAQELGEAVGGQVGYRVRLEQHCSAATRLEVITDGLFLRQLQQDPALEGVAAVIFDEFHERRADADLALALLRQARSLLQPQLRLLLMSATLNLEPLAARLERATVINTAGRSYPVLVAHQPARPAEPLAAQVLRGLEGHWLEERDAGETVLVFLPGQREIRAVQQRLETVPWARELEVAVLHGSLPLAAQSRAILPSRSPAGKVVLATAIAESSLTIEAVRLVIDSGLARRSRFNPASGMDGLVTVAASAASAEQRRGRAGRLAPGRCLRLWSPAERHQRPAFDPPQLLECDPLPIALQLAQWGAGLGHDLNWIDPPPPAGLQEARLLLQQLGALTGAGQLSPHGRAMAELGLHPRLAHMLLQAQRIGQLELASALAALLSERDPLGGSQAGCDLLQRLDWLKQPQACPQRRLIRQLQQQLQQQVQRQRQEPSASPPPSASHPPTAQPPSQAAALLLSWAYPDRIALARSEGQGRYLLRNGRGAWLPPEDPLARAPVLAVAAADGAGQDVRIHLALALQRSELEALAEQEGELLHSVRWDAGSQRVRCERERRLGALVLERSPWPAAPAEQVGAALLEGIRQRGLECLPWTEASRQLQQRLLLAHRHLGEPWPDCSGAWLLAQLEGWLAPHLVGCRSPGELNADSLNEALWGELDWPQRQQLDRWLPLRLPIPSGRQAALDYGSGEPVLAVKLQEMFGCAVSPSVLQGRLPVTVQLLSPAGRPLQVTSDLAGFWQGSYQEVRRQMRGRYPKHPWPEDPANAQPTALTKGRRPLA